MARAGLRARGPSLGGPRRVVGFVYLAYVYLTLPDVRVAGDDQSDDDRVHGAAQARGGRGRPEVQHPAALGSVHADLQQPAARGARRRRQRFFDHDGIDLKELRASLETNWEEGRFTRGASTITQQLAKNLYLSPSRNPMRKLKELFITRRLEAALTKRRILEIYLNVIEWGDGIFGAEAASRAYFGKPAAELTPDEAALLAGAIINPREHSPAHPTARLLRRQQIIVAADGHQASRSPQLPQSSRQLSGAHPSSRTATTRRRLIRGFSNKSATFAHRPPGTTRAATVWQRRSAAGNYQQLQEF